MRDPEQSLFPLCAFHFLPQSSGAEIEPETVIGVIILSHYVAGGGGRNELAVVGYLCHN